MKTKQLLNTKGQFVNLAHYPSLHRKECVITAVHKVTDKWPYKYSVLIAGETAPMVAYDHEVILRS